MNGPQHYAEAERLAELAASPNVPAAKSTLWARRAQVHATLALAAAQAEAALSGNRSHIIPTGVRESWIEVAR